MGGLRRLVLFIFSVAGILCLAALALPWYGLYPEQIAELEKYYPYLVAVDVCLAMTAVWMVANLLRSLFARRNTHSISVMDIDGSAITVTKGAIASQASHIVEQSGLGEAKHVEVHARKRGPVDIEVRITPYASIDVAESAPTLHTDLVSGLSAICAERLGTVNVEFLEPRDMGTLDEFEDTEEDASSEADAQGASQVPDPELTGDITIPIYIDKED